MGFNSAFKGLNWQSLFCFPKVIQLASQKYRLFSSWRWMQHLIVWSFINRSRNHNCNTDLQHLLHCTDDCNFLRCINLELCSKTRADVQICWKEGTLNDNQLNPLRELLEATIYCHWGLWICDNFSACCSEFEVMDCRCKYLGTGGDTYCKLHCTFQECGREVLCEWSLQCRNVYTHIHVTVYVNQ